MKKLNIISIFVFLILGATFTSCETTELELLEDPNNITVDKAVLERYMVAIQADFGRFADAMGRNGAQLTRIEQMSSTSYNNAFDPSSTNYEWRLAYQGMFADMKAANTLAEEAEAFKHQAVLKILQSYTLMNLVDYFGDVPFSEANDLGAYPNPSADDDAAVYEAALAMLDEADILMGLDGGFDIENDLLYNNDYDKWAKFANTLRLNAYVNTRLVDGTASGKFNAIINSDDFISSSSDDLVFNWGTIIITVDEDTEIDTRHPAYAADYSSSGAGRYRSNWLMDTMLNDNDPRSRYYFFRQNDCTPGSTGTEGEECGQNPQALFCSAETAPSHYPGSMVFCSVEQGYWGRDHGFNGGIPPDGFLRTAVGVYPAAGVFDQDDFSQVAVGAGGEGAGITPVMLASWVDFMRAEMALAGGNANSAKSFLEDGMQKSIDKVMSFRTLDPGADDDSVVPTAGDISDFIEAQSDLFSAGDNNTKWNVLGEQYLVAQYGNGSNAYNFYRRTGFPTTLQFNIEGNPGNFVRSFLYPADEANTNSNIQQKPNVNQQVFWDNNPPSPGFPSAN